MGRKGKWFSDVRRTFIPYCCRGDLKESLENSKVSDSFHSKEVENTIRDSTQSLLPAPVQGAKLIEKGEEESKHAYSVALASAVAAEAAAVAAQAAAEVVRLATSASRHTGESRKEIAAIKIQTAYRRYKARRRLGTLRGLVKIKKVLDGNVFKSQTRNSLQCMQTMARVQVQIHARRVRMAEENQALQRHLLRKREKELEKVKIAEDWDTSLLSKEKIEENLLNKHEAAVKRERTLAYAYTHQWRNSSRSLTQALTDPSNTQWGWSWLERWMAARPWDNQSIKKINDHTSIKSIGRSSIVPTTKQFNTSLECTPAAAQKSVRLPIHPSLELPCLRARSVTTRKRSESPGEVSAEKGSLSIKSPLSPSLPLINKRRTTATNIRRHSGPSKVGVLPTKDVTTISEEQVAIN